MSFLSASLLLQILTLHTCHGALAVSEASTAAAAVQPPHGQTAAQLHHGRCRLTQGRWCRLYHSQQPIPAKLAPPYAKTCPGACSGVGVCNAMTGLCDCPAGWAGPSCSEEQKRPCTDGRSAYAGPGSQPSSTIGPDKRDLNWTSGSWSGSRCAGICDDIRGLCYCDPSLVKSRSGSSTAQAGQRGRPLSEHCKPLTTPDGQAVPWGVVPYEDVFGSLYGWCAVAAGVEPALSCGCPIDGQAGKWCESVTEQVCPNSCSGHGRCDGGFCLCDSGWFGHDCAGRVAGQKPDGFNQSQTLRDRPWLAGHLVPPVAAAEPAPGGMRRRPLIYVYDSPAWAAARMMQYRDAKSSCSWRFFEQGNATELNPNYVYAAEPLIHEMLLASPHRTMDPEEADLFYVPACTSCFVWPVYGWADYPWWYSAGGPRVSHMTKMLLELKQHIQQTYPYWNRTNGRDHIWLASHDEGACWFPTEVYEASIILTHWGRMDLQHTSNTAYKGDNYSQHWIDPAHKGFENVSWTALIEGHPCYTPGKDLVIPAPKIPSHYRWSPLLGAPPQPRNTLLYFRGDVGSTRQPNYSRGIRQRLHALAQTPDWKAQYKIKIGTREEVPGDYSQGLASSKFCLVAPGDGWSGRLEDSILHGCIPVIIQDNVHVSFEHLLEFDAFSLRVPEQQLERLPQILTAVSARELRMMQHNLHKVWHRFTYLSQPLLRDSAHSIIERWQQQAGAQQQTPHGRRLTSAAAADPLSSDSTGSRSSAEEGASGGMLESLLARMQRASSSAFSNRRRRTADGASEMQHAFKLTEEHIEDDAFGTIMQWLHARSLQLKHKQRQHVRHPDQQQQ